MRVRRRDNTFEMNFTFEVRAGTHILCVCHAVQNDYSVDIYTVGCKDRFFAWGNHINLISVVDMDKVNRLSTDLDMVKYSLMEWSVISAESRRISEQDIFLHLRYLGACNSAHPCCSHDHRKRPQAPEWYRSLMGFKPRFGSFDIFRGNLYLSRLFRSSTEDGAEESSASSDGTVEPTAERGQGAARTGGTGSDEESGEMPR